MPEISIVVNLPHASVDDDPVILRKSDLDQLTGQIAGSEHINIHVRNDQSGSIYITKYDYRGSPSHHSYQGFANAADMATAITSYLIKEPTK